MRRRLLALVTERNLPPADYAKLMHKRISDSAALAFCEKHKVSIDWLMCGDLQGLSRMVQWRKEAMGAACPGGPGADFLKVFCGLNEKTQAMV